MTTSITGLALLREKFPPHQVSYLPKGGVQLAFVGHAALTDRLLDTDPAWAWEPLALDARGLPALDESGGLWIKLTVCGITRLGYGDAGQKKGGDAMKERIGDALRNAAMRFGAALDLWHKGDLHGDAEPEAEPDEPKKDTSPAAVAQRLKAGVSAGDAAGVAHFLSTQPEARLAVLWELLDVPTQEKITAAWPKAEA